MEINGKRLWDSLLRIGKIGKEQGGGITRLPLSKEYKEASSVLVELLEKANLKVSIDNLGNIIGKREGKDNSLPSIMIGSHLDTVVNGGLFDGTLGIVAGLECINYLNDNDIVTNHPIEIIAFNFEEGSELGGTFASRSIMGLVDLNQEGLEGKLKKYGLTLHDVKSVIRDPGTIKEYIELHIEQGGVLYSKGIPVGIVNEIVGIRRYKVIVKGEANHGGTTPMYLRRDPLIAAAKLIIAIEAIVKDIGEPLVATVGYINAYPGGVNVIPGEVEFTLELRDISQEKIDLAVERIMAYSKEIREVDFDFQFITNNPPVSLDEGIQNTIEESCRELGISYIYMASGAGHDASPLSRKVPAGMIFVPSREGRSHCPEEWTDLEDIVKGVKVLIATVLKRDRM